MNILKRAHQLTKEIKREYPEVDYKAQLGICLTFLYNNKEVKGMVELEGTEKQVKYAERLREKLNQVISDMNELETVGDEFYKEERKVISKKVYEVKTRLENETKASKVIDMYKYLLVSSCNKLVFKAERLFENESEIDFLSDALENYYIEKGIM